MGRVLVELALANYQDMLLADAGTLAPDKVRQTRLPGIVDTGATRLVLPEAVVTQLGLPAAGETKVRYADQRSTNRPMVRDVWVTLQGRRAAFTAIVEPDRRAALIGAIVLEELDLVVDHSTQTLHPRDPDRIVSEIE
ncbi:MAG TPA: aspartyl protease family protein [Gemmataceae bacterium]|jgi:predicted aspartyl protease|nr:aspartyl protease family protein [Gemmataceae bacterium]